MKPGSATPLLNANPDGKNGDADHPRVECLGIAQRVNRLEGAHERVVYGVFELRVGAQDAEQDSMNLPRKERIEMRDGSRVTLPEALDEACFIPLEREPMDDGDFVTPGGRWNLMALRQ